MADISFNKNQPTLEASLLQFAANATTSDCFVYATSTNMQPPRLMSLAHCLREQGLVVLAQEHAQGEIRYMAIKR